MQLTFAYETIHEFEEEQSYEKYEITVTLEGLKPAGMKVSLSK